MAGERDLAADRYARAAELYPRYAGKTDRRDGAITFYAQSAAREADNLGRFDPATTSRDPRFGTTPATPVPVGAAGPAGPPALGYLWGLRDLSGRRVRAERLGSVDSSAGGGPVDVYQVATSTGERFLLYLDTRDVRADSAAPLAPSVLRKSRL